MCRLAGVVLPPPTASVAAAAADVSDADATTDGDGAGEEGEDAGVVTDAVPPGKGVDWALARPVGAGLPPGRSSTVPAPLVVKLHQCVSHFLK